MLKKRRDFTVHISVPTEVERHYINILTPAQRLASLVEAGRKHQDQLLKEERKIMKRIIRLRQSDNYDWMETEWKPNENLEDAILRIKKNKKLELGYGIVGNLTETSPGVWYVQFGRKEKSQNAISLGSLYIMHIDEEEE